MGPRGGSPLDITFRHCEDCDFQFPTQRSARNHAELTGHMSSRYCKPCDKLLHTPKGLSQHQASSSEHSSTLISMSNGYTPASTESKLPSLATAYYDWVPEDETSMMPPPEVLLSKPTTGTGWTSQEQLHSPYNYSYPLPVFGQPNQRPRQSSAAIQPRESQPNTGTLTPGDKMNPDGNAWQQTKRQRRRSEANAQSEPLLPPVYPAIEIAPYGQFPYGYQNNPYTLYMPQDQEAIFEALKLRCHTIERLKNHKYIVPGQLEKEWVVIPKGLVEADFVATPAQILYEVKRRVVALDCEMVGIQQGPGPERDEVSELAQICVVDVLTGEILINKLVRQYSKVINWRTRYSGITPDSMRMANAKGESLNGWRAARYELFRYIDAETILVGHDLSNDLNILRTVHGRVVDTSLQTAEAVHGYNDRLRRIWGLKELARVLLGLEIQIAGKKGHDCVEDTLVTREIAVWCVTHPNRLEKWADEMRAMLERQRAEQERKREERKKREEEKRKKEAEEAAKRQLEEAERAANRPYDPFDPSSVDDDPDDEFRGRGHYGGWSPYAF